MADNVAKLRGLQDTAALLLPQLYHLSDGLPAGGSYEPALAVLRKHPDLSTKLVKKFGLEHPTSTNLDKVDKAGADFLHASAPGILQCLAPAYGLFEEVAIFQEHTLRVMTDMSQSLLPFSVAYTPQLLDAYMCLFVDACKVHMLAARVPRALIIQYYTVAYNHVHTADPPHIVEVSNFTTAFQDAIPRLQAEFQPISTRIGEVLEKIVAPLVCHTLELKQLQACHVFNWKKELQLPSVSEQDLLAAISRAGKLQEWAMYGILICPGETCRIDVRNLLASILKTTFQFVVFRKHAEWAHPLMERHVIPILSNVAKKDHWSWGEKRDVKKIAEKAFGDACTSAANDHRTRRIWLQQQLQIVFTHLQEDVSVLPANISTIMALLTLSRAEIEWILLHGGNNLPRNLPISWVRSGFSLSQPLKASFPDSSIVKLISAHCNVMQCLLRFKHAIQTTWIWLLWEQLQKAVRPLVLKVAGAPTLTRHHQPVVRTIERLLVEYSDTCHVLLTMLCSGEGSNATEEDSTAENKIKQAVRSLPKACEIWFSLNCQLFTVRTNVSAQSLDALCKAEAATAACGPGAEKGSGTSLIQELNTASKLAEMVASVEVELRLAGSLEYAGFQESKLQAIFAAAIKGHSDLALHATSFIPVLLDFHYNDHPKCHEHHGEVASRMGEKLMQSVSLRIRTMLHELHDAVFLPQSAPPQENLRDELVVGSGDCASAQHAGGSISLSSLTGSLKVPLSVAVKTGKEHRISVDPTESGSASSSHRRTAPIYILGACFRDEAAAQLLHRLIALVSACSRDYTPSHGVLMSCQTVLLPIWWLHEAVVAGFRSFLRQSVWKGKTLQRPSHLEKMVASFLCMLDALQPHTSLDFRSLIREILLCQSYSDLPFEQHQDQCRSADMAQRTPSAHNHSAGQMADWLVAFIANDRLDNGITYSVKNTSFFTRTGGIMQEHIKAATSGIRLDASMHASLVEFRALVRVFGPYVVADLGKKLGLISQECVMSLGILLKEYERDLSRSKARPDDVQGWSQSSHVIRQAQSIFKQLGRCLFMRQLCTSACGVELARSAPGLATGLSFLQSSDCGKVSLVDESASWSDAATSILGLPVCAAFGARDPLLLEAFANISDEDLKRWELLPIFAALAAWTADANTGLFFHDWDTLPPEMNSILHAVLAIAPCLQQAAHTQSISSENPQDIVSVFSSMTAKLALQEGLPTHAHVMLLREVQSTCGARRGALPVPLSSSVCRAMTASGLVDV
mmetsp:Transcript_42380/g.108423  ORF Transcript_42380/g.108423 Transcript_42380/m.108423 type:complete len:1253 (-) Transcript_42380:98-3856(-)